MQRISEHNRNGGSRVDFKTHTRKVMDEYRRRIGELREDPRLPSGRGSR